MTPPLAADRGIRLKSERPGEHRAACPKCDKTKRRPRDDALAVKIEPDGLATWLCHRCGWKGSLPPPGGPQERRKAWAKGDPGSRPTAPAAPPKPHPNMELAQEIWRQTVEITDDLPLSYLLDRRGIEVWDDDRLRWHPKCPWDGARTGCIIAPVVSHVTGYTVAIWRIKPVLKGKVERRGLGPVQGNAARLFPTCGPKLVIAEGVEDALAAAELFKLPAWAALFAGNMAGLVLPDRFRDVLILADRDENGVGLEGARKLARRLRAEGRTADVRWPKSHKDPNDVVLARGAAA